MDGVTYIGEWKGIKLEPCPFCGCKAVLTEYYRGGSIHCSNGRCRLNPQTGLCNSPQSAVDSWNMRGKEDFLRFQKIYTLNAEKFDYPFDER